MIKLFPFMYLISNIFVAPGIKYIDNPIQNPGNVLMIIADDLGVNSLECYGLRDDITTYPFPNTPNIDLIKQNGVLFKNVYANPTCSPTRCGIQTGKYGFRLNIGSPVTTSGLSQNELIIPEILDLQNEPQYNHALIGKWHISDITQEPFTAPNDHGYGYFSGARSNISNYCLWEKIQNGVSFSSTAYATVDNTIDAINWINNQVNNWFLVLAFNAPHSPYHIPLTCETNQTEFFRYQQMIEMLDQQIGALLGSINLQSTTVIFLGDNGSPSSVTVPPFDPNRAKFSIYEGGVRVPLIIGYNKVIDLNRESSHLVNTTDLFATSLDLMGIENFYSQDSVSLLPILQHEPFKGRSYIFSERFPNGIPQQGDCCIRNNRYKYIKYWQGQEEFYNIMTDPYENYNMLGSLMTQEAQKNLNTLRFKLYQLRTAIVNPCPECNQGEENGADD